MLSGLPRHRPIWGRLFAAFALVAFAVRAITPAGYMFAPSQEPGRFITVTLCSAHGSELAVLDRQTGEFLPDGDETPKDDDEPQNTACVFATAANLAAPETSPALIANPIAVTAPINAPEHLAPGRGLAAPPPFPTGPPATA